MPLSQQTSVRRNHVGYLCPYSNNTISGVAVKNVYDMCQPNARWIGQAVIACATGANLVDTDYFTVSDGRRSVVFEFDSNASVTNGRTGITYAGGNTAAQNATAVAAAINAAFPQSLRAVASSGSVYVFARHAGTQGCNITENVAHASFVVTNQWTVSSSNPMPVMLGGRPRFVAFSTYGT